MGMNRQTKRLMQRQGQVTEDGSPAVQRRQPPRPQNVPRPGVDRGGLLRRAATFIREVRGELRKVAWPTREEIIRYSIIVLVTVVLLTAFVNLVDYVSTEAILYLFD